MKRGAKHGFNIIPDYFSLLESRFIIKVMSNKKSLMFWFGLIIVDLLATTMIFIISVSIVILLDRLFISGNFEGFIELYKSIIFPQIVKGLSFQNLDREFPSLGIFFYSTFFTSAWVLLYALSGGLVRLTVGGRPVLHFLKWFLDIENHPVRSIGIIAGAFACFFFWVLSLLVQM